MNRFTPELTDALAARYVSGTMGRLARQRFEHYLQRSPLARRAVAEWQEALQPLVSQIKPVNPPRRVWRQIKHRIQPTAEREPSLWGSVVWPSATAAMAMLVLTLGVLLWREAPRTEYVAAVTADSGQVVWSVVFDDADNVRVNAAAVPSLAADRVHELWVLPADGSDPVSLGLIPQTGEWVNALSERQQTALVGATTLAVSVEPSGGSPSGVPTGPVVFTAPLTQAQAG